MVAGVTEQWLTLCMDHSARNKDQKLVSRFYEDRIFYRLVIAVPLRMYRKFGQPKADFGQLNAKIGHGEWPTVISSIWITNRIAFRLLKRSLVFRAQTLFYGRATKLVTSVYVCACVCVYVCQQVCVCVCMYVFV